MSGYDRVRFEFGLDLSMLTVLTNFNVGKSAITTLASDPARLPSLLVLEPQYSYLSFVPSRYEHSAILASATDCVIAKVRAALSPGFESDATARRLYGKALRTLQEAINDPCSRGDADVLCAIQMLSIHELLDPSRENAWSNHISGSSQLVRSRNPASFSSEYDKSLFVGHVGPALSEALFNNHSCCLETPEWKSLYMSTVQETEHLTERSELVLNARKHMFPLPRLWRDVGAALTSNDLFNDNVLRGLEKRCRSAHGNFLAWLEEYKCHCVARSFIQPSQLEMNLRRETFGAVLECLLITKRLITSLSESDRLNMECETQAIAKLIMDLQDQPMPKHSWLFAAHEIGVAQVCFATKEIFEQDSPENQKLAMRNRYMAFSGALRGT
ncbi:hypothetical protein AC579_1806 [Pseudocercospora musae]|uniref:Transcription factor domain-containing protein n=1 Tax=Pseudocercospora musae TaxID=113226 RepID=A0A139IDE6_9PEZI|nr:hypothetical protein AC579_1806 [Pseudocercospora musae]